MRLINRAWVELLDCEFTENIAYQKAGAAEILIVSYTEIY